MQQPHDLEQQVTSTVRDFANSINSSRKVMADMSALVEVTSQLPLSNLDYWERLIRWEYSNALESHSQPKWKARLKPSQLLTWLDLISEDGYKREKTLRTITGAAPNSFFYALALRRLNDWVLQVREAATEILPLITDSSDPIHATDALCITLSHWSSWGRIGEPEKQSLLQIIGKKAIANALKGKLITSTSGPMPSLFAQIGRTPALDKNISEISQNAIQPAVRAKAFRSQLEGKITWVEGRKWEWTDIRYCEGRLQPIVAERKLTTTTSFSEVLRTAAVDRSSIVRRVAAEFLIREFESLGAESTRLATLFAADKSLVVSERGKFALKLHQKKLEGISTKLQPITGILPASIDTPTIKQEHRNYLSDKHQ